MLNYWTRQLNQNNKIRCFQELGANNKVKRGILTNLQSRSVLLAVSTLCMAPLLAQTGQGVAGPDWALLDKYCVTCHNLDDQAGSLAFDLLTHEHLVKDNSVWEKAIRKIRTGMMPPAGKERPPRTVLDAFAAQLGAALDNEQAPAPNPGNAGIGRLNREEYANAIRDLLAFDAAAIVATLPREAAGAGFNNNVDVLSVSPTLIDAFASAAMRIGREAVGDLSLIPTQVIYPVPAGAQDTQLEGLPLGTRSGLLVTHNFPLDAQYEILVNARGAGGVFNNQAFCTGNTELMVTLDGNVLKPDNPSRFQIPIPAGPHELAAALIDSRRCEGVNDFYDVFNREGAIASVQINGPFEVKGAGNTPSRRAIFSCYPQAAKEEASCAQAILTRLATAAYRRPLQSNAAEVAELLAFFDKGRTLGGFEVGIQYALSRMLMDPRFLYQIEQQPAGLAAGKVYALGDLELASRLSFFLWSSIPDKELLDIAASGKLHESAVLAQQVARMQRDARADALVQNFAGQWLKLRDLDNALPQDTAFNAQLRKAFRQETELLFNDLMRQNLGLLQLLDSGYTWLNAELAGHYGIEGVRGDYMRRVTLPENSPRRGLLGQGSILTATSVANRTSPVIRGAWIVEDLLGAPVPTPPPGIKTDLTQQNTPQGQSTNTLRERLELHHANPTCASCHQIMDPFGLALENFDLVGRWRTQDSGYALNTRTTMIDGTPIDGPVTLRKALLARGDVVAANIIEKLLSYALGRSITPADMPAVRKIAAATAGKGYRFADVVLAIVSSMPFQNNIAVNEPDLTVAALAEGTTR